MKVLFIVPYPTAGASNRLRVEQYLPYLEEKGITYRLRPFISDPFYRIVYMKGRYFLKAFFFLASALNRVCDIMRGLRYDIIFIHREAFPFGPPVIEMLFHFFKKKIIFDFDDAIFLPRTSKTNMFMEGFKEPGKISKIISMSEHVIAGNDYLKTYAKKFNRRVTVIPTPIDTDKYTIPKETGCRNKIVIGWIGSATTQDYLESMKRVFLKLSSEFPRVSYKIVGGKADFAGIRNVEFKDWSLEEEIGDLSDFTIGIMPMPDDEWTKGKCGFKLILYMSMGIATVASPVGTNKDIVKDGENGFLAKDTDEWVNKLSRLIRSREDRTRFSLEGRKMAEEIYSIKANAPAFVNILEETYAK